MEKKNGKRLKKKKGKGRRRGKWNKAEKKAGRLGTEKDTGEGDRGAGQRRGERRHPHRSLGTQEQEGAAQEKQGANRSPPSRPPSRSTAGAPTWSSAPPARLCHRLGARPRAPAVGFVLAEQGRTPSHRRIPALPELGTVGVGTGSEGRGPEEQQRAPPSLGFLSFAPFRNWAVVLPSGGGQGCAGGGRAGKEAPVLNPKQGRGAALPARGRGFVWYACMHGWMETCMYAWGEPLNWIPRSRFLAEGLGAAGHLRSVLGYLLRSALEVFGGRGWALWTRPGSGDCPRRARRSLWRRPVAGDKEADTGSKQRTGAHMHPRARPTQSPSPWAPAPRCSGLCVWKVRSFQSWLPSLTIAFSKRRLNVCHPLPSHPQRCGQIARVTALLLFVKQALSLGRGARGMWRIPGQDYINQSIISPEKWSTNESKS